MNTDAYFEIGSTHIVCEDYALTGTSDGELAYAILCDGCSSSKHTDLGARLLAHIAKDALLYLNRRKLLHIENQNLTIFLDDLQELFKELVLKKVSEVKATLCLNTDAFDATLLISVVVGPLHRFIMSWGDGYFLIKRKPPKDCTIYGIEMISTEYLSGAPFYLSYALSHDRSISYRDTFGNFSINRYRSQFVHNSTGIVELNKSKKIKSLEDSSMESIFIDESEETVQDPKDYFEQPIAQIIMSSDGLGTYKKGQEEISIPSLLPEILNYKNPKGEFVQRRMRNTVSRDHREQGITHYDDISFAVINLV